mgnify:CR=1 FL=1
MAAHSHTAGSDAGNALAELAEAGGRGEDVEMGRYLLQPEALAGPVARARAALNGVVARAQTDREGALADARAALAEFDQPGAAALAVRQQLSRVVVQLVSGKPVTLPEAGALGPVSRVCVECGEEFEAPRSVRPQDQHETCPRCRKKAPGDAGCAMRDAGSDGSGRSDGSEVREMAETQECAQCRDPKPLSEFMRYRNGKPASVCKACQSANLAKARAEGARKRTAAKKAAAAPAVAGEKVRQLAGEAFAAIRAASGCRTILDAGPLLLDAAAALARIEAMLDAGP